ncbi:MAG: DUF3795 domain-containing protein [Eubacterium sp.]|nr:DUF3795 domain-containing protein [Eubacterium sp.]
MANYSVCGIDCDICKYKEEMNCKGCKEIKGNVFWGDCELYQCNCEKKQEHCGKCSQFPCNKLKEWASTDNPERIDNLKNLI